MKRLFGFLFLTGLIVLLSQGCQKELSLEVGKNVSEGSLQSGSTGDCLPKTVAGAYEKGTPLDGSVNYLEVEVDVTKPGSYIIYTDTINGIYFRATGIFTTTGLTTVKLKGTGTPLNNGISNFVVTYGTSECLISVTILPSGSSGPAVFTLSGSPGTCMNYNLSGTYTAGIPLTSSNFVTINVNVTTIGTYNVTTNTSNGVTFSGSGVLSSTGAQTITLTASGTPAAAGNTPIPITIGSSSCSFVISVEGSATYTVNCGSAIVNGTYEAGLALDATNTVDIDVNVTAVGGYSISGTINGMTFTKSGNFTVTGLQTITLNGSGTPSTDGTFNVPLTGGTTSCTFEVIVDPGSAPTDLNWKFTQGSMYGGPTTGAVEASFSGRTAMNIVGENTAGDWQFVIALGKAGSMQTGSFNSNSMTNTVLFSVINTTTLQTVYSATFGDGTNLLVNLTTYNTTTKIVEGNFSGTVKNSSGSLVTISAGTFKAELQ